MPLFRLFVHKGARNDAMQSAEVTDIVRYLSARLRALERPAGLGAVIKILDDEGNSISDETYADKIRERKVSSKPGKSYKIPQHIMQRIRDRTDLYWSVILDQPVHFEQSEVDVAYTTASDVALFRNGYMSSFFFNPPVVVDAYAGIGFDTISFLYNLYFKNGDNVKRIYSVENDDDTDRNSRLIHNVTEFVRLKDEQLAHRIEFFLNGTEKFFQQCKYFAVEPVDSIDLLYVDPPWTLPFRPNSGENGEATPQELLEFMYDTIFRHLIENRIRVKVVCIKTRFDWKHCEPIMDILRAHIKEPTEQFTHTTTVESTPFNHTFYFHIIKTLEAEYGKYQQSDVFKFAYGTGSEKDRASFRDRHKVVRHTRDGPEVVADTHPGQDRAYQIPKPGGSPDRPYRPSMDPGTKHDEFRM